MVKKWCPYVKMFLILIIYDFMQVVVSRVVLPGGAVYFVFIWLVVPVIVTFTCAETAAMCLFWCHLGYFIFEITYCFFLYLGGAVSPGYDEF